MRVATNGIELEVDVRGRGPAVLLLHGWPDTHALWDAQVAALVNAGFTTIAPDQRGFGASERPANVEHYALANVVADAMGVRDALGVERAHVIGHDFGAAVAWLLASVAPKRVDHLVALSVGHPMSFASAGMAQREKSWYMLLFQWVGVAEQWLRADDWANFRAWASHPGTDEVVARLADPDALTASLNWYRANFTPERLVEPPLTLPPIEVPTMGVWSNADFALLEPQMRDSAMYVKGEWRYETIDRVGHWMQLEAPDLLNALLLDFLPRP